MTSHPESGEIHSRQSGSATNVANKYAESVDPLADSGNTLGNAHLPQRTCIGCRTRRPVGELTRISWHDTSGLGFGRATKGRGAWLCQGNDACVSAAFARRAFPRAFRRSLDESVLAQIADSLEKAQGMTEDPVRAYENRS
ncbi:MAG: DUF448 domain-containing protein [Acidimicrobiia bacterium]|nr:DUF448 domain-containing protein [Acidimicrobiia bacterium]MBP8181873.1 DUF448 domain-containing protein [Acidimicrobiia bacterium]